MSSIKTFECDKKEKDFRVCFTWEELEWISHYYSFQTIVFLLDKKYLRKKLKGKKRKKITD